MKNKLQLWTDGSCKKNGQKGAYGGWAAIIIDKEMEGEFRACGREESTTNNIMEMKAMINGLKTITDFYGDNVEVTVYSDSAYVLNCRAQRWYENWRKNGWKNAKREKVKNRELWEELIPYFENPNFSFEKVAGHVGIRYNEMVDTLAQGAAENQENFKVPISGEKITWTLFKWEDLIFEEANDKWLM